jgi:heme-degrading monooxygenase HmoA
MPAHVWQLHVRPCMVQDFKEILSSLVELAREQDGYRGIVALSSGKSESPDVTLIALWDSLEAKTVYFSRRQFPAFWFAVTAYRTSRNRICSRATSSLSVPPPRRECLFSCHFGVDFRPTTTLNACQRSQCLYGPTPRRPPHRVAGHKNATPHLRRGYHRTTYRISDSESWRDEGMARRYAIRPDRNASGSRLIVRSLP